MEQLRQAANVAASYVGLGGSEDNRETETSQISGGEAPQNVTTSHSQSGIEPVSGKLGRGEAGEPYDAGNEEGAAGLGGSAAQNPSSGYTSHSTTGHGLGTSGTSGTGLTSNTSSSSKPVREQVRETFGVGGSDKHGIGLGGRTEGPGYGTASKHDRDGSRLGSVVGHGSNPDRYLYNSKTAPGLGGHHLGGHDDFTDSNTRHEGAESLPSALGSDVAAGHAKHSSSSGGLTSGLSSTGSGHDRGLASETSRSGTTSHHGTGSSIGSGLAAAGAAVGLGSNQHHGEQGKHTTETTRTGTGSGTGETLARKAEQYLPGTSSTSTTHGREAELGADRGPRDDNRNAALAGATAAASSVGRNNTGYDTSYATQDTSNLAGRGSHDRGIAGSTFDGAGVGGVGSSFTSSQQYGSGAGLSGAGLSGGHSGLAHIACEEEREGYKPHGGHPIGEAAHSTEEGKQTWLDYRNDPTLPIARGKPADL